MQLVPRVRRTHSLALLLVAIMLLFCQIQTAFGGDQKLVEFRDQAYGATGWKVINVPKTKDKGRWMYWAEWRLEPVIVQPRSGETKVSMRVEIRAASSTLANGANTMPDAVDIRIDDKLLNVTRVRRSNGDMWVNGHNYGTTSVEFSIDDPLTIERIANSRDSWMIGYTRYGNKDRREIEIPASWKRALSLILSQYQRLTSDAKMTSH